MKQQLLKRICVTYNWIYLEKRQLLPVCQVFGVHIQQTLKFNVEKMCKVRVWLMLFWFRLHPFQRRLQGKFSRGRLPGSVWLGSPQNRRGHQWKLHWKAPGAAVHNRWAHPKPFVSFSCFFPLSLPMLGCLHVSQTSVATEWYSNCPDPDRWSQCIHHVGQPSLELRPQRGGGGDRASVSGPRLHPRHPARRQDHRHAEGSSGKVHYEKEK